MSLISAGSISLDSTFKQFLANLNYWRFKIIFFLYGTQWLPKNYNFFLHMSKLSKNAKFYADFKSVKIIGNKGTRKKFLTENFSKLVPVIEKSANFKFLPFFACNFLQLFRVFLNGLEISIKFCVFWILLFKFCQWNGKMY